MWKVTIKQEYEYSFIDGNKSTGTHDIEFVFEKFHNATAFVKEAIENGTTKTHAIIEYIEIGEEHEQS